VTAQTMNSIAIGLCHQIKSNLLKQKDQDGHQHCHSSLAHDACTVETTQKVHTAMK